MEESSAPAPADVDDADAASVTLPEVYEDAPEDWRLSMAVEDGPEKPRLPEGWAEHIDDATQHPYYHHEALNVTQWEFPSANQAYEAEDEDVSRAHASHSSAPQASQPLYFEAAQASQKMGPVVGHAGFSARFLSGEPVHARGSRALLSSDAAQEGQVARLHQRVAARSQLTHFRKPPSTPRSGAASKDTALTPRDRGRRSGELRGGGRGRVGECGGAAAVWRVAGAFRDDLPRAGLPGFAVRQL